MRIKISHKKIFYPILFLALLPRIYIVFFSGLSWYSPDSKTYLDMASGIINGNPVSYFPNGFPLLLSVLLYISSSNVLIIVVLLNIILQVTVIVLIEKILAHYNIQEAIRLAIAFVVALYPHQISNVRFIQSETFSMFLLIMSILFYTKKKYLASGFAGYLTFMFRPSLLLVTPFIILYSFIRKEKIAAVKMLVGFLVCLLIFFFLDYSRVTAPPSSQIHNTLVAIQSFGYDAKYDLKNFSAEELSHPVKTYFSFAINHPLDYLEQRILSFWSLWGIIVPSNYGISGNILHGIRFPLFVLAVLAYLFRKRMIYNRELITLTFLPIVSLTFIHLLFFSNQRHQFAAEPFVIILSVFFVAYLFKLRRKQKGAQILHYPETLKRVSL